MTEEEIDLLCKQHGLIRTGRVLEAITPLFSLGARAKLEATAEAEEACGDESVADALNLALEKDAKARKLYMEIKPAPAKPIGEQHEREDDTAL